MTDKMKVLILAGGYGSRLAEETQIKPKPMVEIGGRPIMWHIMMHYMYYGFEHFIICLGYKGDEIKRYILDYSTMHSDIRAELSDGIVTFHDNSIQDCIVELIDTGIDSQTGGRIKRLAPSIKNNTFMATYGDGVSDVNLKKLLAFHKSHGKLATLTAVRPPARYGFMQFKGDQVIEFYEKPQIGEGWINGAYFVLEPGVLEYIDGDDSVWEKEPLEKLARDGQLMAYRHTSFWQCMDTMREKYILESLWQSGKAPWKVWD